MDFDGFRLISMDFDGFGACRTPEVHERKPPQGEAAFGRLHRGGRAPSAPAPLCGLPCGGFLSCTSGVRQAPNPSKSIKMNQSPLKFIEIHRNLGVPVAHSRFPQTLGSRTHVFRTRDTYMESHPHAITHILMV